MLYALQHPLALLALVVGFLLALLLRGLVQAWVATAVGVQDFELTQRRRVDIRRHIDPFGAAIAALSGTGFGRSVPVEGLLGRFAYGRARGAVAGRAALVLLSGPIACVLVGVGALLAARAVESDGLSLRGLPPSDTLHGDHVNLFATAPEVLICVGIALLAFGILAFIPIPPLDGGRLLLALAPTTAGWQRVRHYADQNWGVAILLVLLLLPLAGRDPLLLVLIDAIGQPIVDAVGR